MDNGTSRAQVRRIVGEMSPLGAREANSGDRLVEDLGYDSLAVIELSLRPGHRGLRRSAAGGTERRRLIHPPAQRGTTRR